MVNNTRLDRIIFYHKVCEMVELMESYYIIVYGYNLCIYECIHFLVTHGCKAQNIIYVQPHVPIVMEDLGIPEKDSRLDPIILEMIADLGVTIYLSTNYSQFILSQDNMNIEKVELIMHPSKKKIVLHCDLFVNYNDNTISSSMENGRADQNNKIFPYNSLFFPSSL